MTVVEVLVASIVSALVATGAAATVSAGGQVTDRVATHLSSATAVARLVDRWPAEIARSVDQQFDGSTGWRLCAPPACGGPDDVPITSPADGWTLIHIDTAPLGGGVEVRLHWQLPDSSVLTLTGWRGPP